ncbi:MAG: hypothetical protein V4534_01325 [Myxococcota bacterium]
MANRFNYALLTSMLLVISACGADVLPHGGIANFTAHPNSVCNVTGSTDSFQIECAKDVDWVLMTSMDGKARITRADVRKFIGASASSNPITLTLVHTDGSESGVSIGSLASQSPN